MLQLSQRGSRGVHQCWTVFSRGKKRYTRTSDFGEKSGKVFSKSFVKSSNGQVSESKDINQLFKPVTVVPNADDINLGEEMAGKISKQSLLKKLNHFYLRKEVKILAKEHGLDDYLYHQAYISFRKYCLDVKHLPTELYILFSDVLKGSAHVDDIFPYFLRHARKVFPHLDCLEDLRVISDLTDP
jgi:hypothetical protein